MSATHKPKMVEHGALRRVAPRAAAQQTGSWSRRMRKNRKRALNEPSSGAGILPARFIAPKHHPKIIKTIDESRSERGCVEDQPQRVATLGDAVAQARLGPEPSKLSHEPYEN